MGWKRGSYRKACAVAAVFALCSISPTTACAAPDAVVEDIKVTVPTEIPCSLMPDGTVMVPSGLSIENGSGELLAADVRTADAKGHMVDFTLDIGGINALTRSNGNDSAPALGVDVGAGANAMALNVSELTRQSNAALIDAATAGKADMFELGFKFNLRELQGQVPIDGEPMAGSELTARVIGAQDDAKLAYQWYSIGSASETLVNEDVQMFGEVSREFTCGTDAVVSASIMDSGFIRNGVSVKVLDAETGQEVTSDLILSPGSSVTLSLPKAGRYRLKMMNTDPLEHSLYASVSSDMEVKIDGATGMSYTPSSDNVGKKLFCKVVDSSGKYTGTLQSNLLMMPKKLTGMISIPSSVAESHLISEPPVVRVGVLRETFPADADLRYEWREASTGAPVEGAEGLVYTPKPYTYQTVTFMVTDASGKYTGSISENIVVDYGIIVDAYFSAGGGGTENLNIVSAYDQFGYDMTRDCYVELVERSELAGWSSERLSRFLGGERVGHIVDMSGFHGRSVNGYLHVTFKPRNEECDLAGAFVGRYGTPLTVLNRNGNLVEVEFPAGCWESV